MNTDINQEAIVKIAKLNDEYRRGTKFTLTRGVQELVDFLGLIESVREYKDFNEDNDTYCEHDFGCTGALIRSSGRSITTMSF